MLEIEKIATTEGLEQLRAEWNLLLERSGSNSITLTHEWVSTWWEVFSDSRELYVLVVTERGRVVGIAPLLRRSVQHYGLLAYSRLEFLASGEDEADEICSEYLDFIAERGREREVMECVMNYLMRQQKQWDEMLLSDLAGESPNLEAIADICSRKGAKEHIVRSENCIYIDLPGDWNAYLKTLSRRFRTKIQKDRKAWAANGGELRVIGSEEGFQEHFDMLVKLHQARWTGRGEPGVFASEKFTRFHRLLAPKLLKKGWLKLLVLFVGAEPIAALYLFTYNGKMLYYQGGFVKTDHRIASPGFLAQSFAIEKAIEMGLSEFDLLKGDLDSYKSRWGSRARSIVQLRLAQPQPKEVLYATTTKLISSLRHLKRAFQVWLFVMTAEQLIRYL